MRRSAVVVVISSEGPVNRDLVASLFERHRLPVYRFLRRLLRDGAVAEDLTQETFLRALSGRYHADGRERAWVFQIARNLARDHVRAGARRPALVELRDVANGGDFTRATELDAALAALGEEDREVFLLKEIGGLSYSEIADACDLTPDAVRSRLHRTRLILRSALGAPAPVKACP
jgi:RNA polymerase sigma-70 factor (ECF subfamily)